MLQQVRTLHKQIRHKDIKSICNNFIGHLFYIKKLLNDNKTLASCNEYSGRRFFLGILMHLFVLG